MERHPGLILAAVELPQLDESTQIQYDRDWIVTVFDNSTNTWEEVITILMLATHCDEEEAIIETWEIDNLGKSVVHHGTEKDCRAVAEVISVIGISVSVTQED